MEEKIGIMLSFIAVLIGVFGDTWDPKKKGTKKLLPMGWLTIFIAAIFLLFNLYQAQKNDDQEKHLKESAILSLEEPLSKLISPFKNLLLFHDKNYNNKNVYTIFSQKDTFFIYLRMKEFLSDIDTIKVNTKVFSEDSLTWQGYFKTNNDEARQLLVSFLGTYLNHLDQKTIFAINDILQDPVFRSILRFEPERLSNTASQLERIDFKESDISDLLQLYYPVDHYDNYLRKIKNLYDIYLENRRMKK